MMKRMISFFAALFLVTPLMADLYLHFEMRQESAKEELPMEVQLVREFEFERHVEVILKEHQKKLMILVSDIVPSEMLEPLSLPMKDPIYFDIKMSSLVDEDLQERYQVIAGFDQEAYLEVLFEDQSLSIKVKASTDK